MFNRLKKDHLDKAKLQDIDNTVKKPILDLESMSKQNKIFAIVAIVLFVFAVFLGWHHGKLSDKANTYDLALTAVQNRHANLTEDTTTYISTPNGQVDENAANTIKNLQKLFTQLTDYTSGQTYQDNINLAKQSISDQSFYSKDGFLPLLDNADPSKSTVQLDKIKSEPNYVHVYELDSNHYLVFTSQFLYHNGGDLQYKNKLKSTDNALYVTATATKISSVQTLNQPLLTN